MQRQVKSTVFEEQVNIPQHCTVSCGVWESTAAAGVAFRGFCCSVAGLQHSQVRAIFVLLRALEGFAAQGFVFCCTGQARCAVIVCSDLLCFLL